MKTDIRNIILLGAGNVATHLGVALHKQGHRIIQVFSRTDTSARRLAGMVNSSSTTKLSDLDYSGDLYLFCLKDDAIQEVLKQIRFTNQVLVHTSGSLPMDIFKNSGIHYGVTWPVQTLIRERLLDLSDVPFCIEASTPYAENILKNLISGLSGNIHLVSSEKRKIIHLAAVFACNFTNHMYFIADKLMRDNQLDFEILYPLIRETAIKIQEIDPGIAQTGPAKRGDNQILKKHLQLLKSFPSFQKIYTFVSESIAVSNKKKLHTND